MSAATLPPADDPYAPRLTLWQRRPHLGWTLAVFAATALLGYVAFPPVNAGEAAYVFAVPALLWAYRRPPFRLFAVTVLGASALAWTLLLGWLHHVTWAGLLLLGPFVGLIMGSWFLAAGWTLPRLRGHKVLIRLIALLGLAGLWVVLEWVRGTIFGGFPWLPLAASQWQRPLILQSAAVGGAWAVSFLLVFFNLGTAAYAHRIFFEGATGLRKRSPEFMTALLLLVFASVPFLAEAVRPARQRLVRLSLVQPYVPQGEKWDEAHATDILRTLDQLTLAANDAGAPDAILWPEAVTPWALHRDPSVGPWLTSLAHRTGKPLLLGTIYTEGADGPAQRWFNGAVVVDPVRGLIEPPYAKRHLVPFGEYIPLRSVFGWLEKVVPIGGDFEPGTGARPVELPVGRSKVPVGVLICYEDIFPALARANVLEGAELLAVLTNNGWFGEGGAAYQHAAHSVLRAVETRRPVVRVGNGGWSGWIDEYGYIRAELRDGNESIYFRGYRDVIINRDLRWRDELTFYTRRGDWFVLMGAVLATAAFYVVVTLRPAPLRAEGETVF